MKDDIRPIPKREPQKPKSRNRKDFSQEPGQEKTEAKKKEKPEVKKNTPKEQSQVSAITKKNRQKLAKERRRSRVQAQEKLNRRPDLTFFWLLISLIILSSLIVLAYYSFHLGAQNPTGKQELASQDEIASQEEVSLADSFYFYQTGNDQEVKIIKSYLGLDGQEEVIVRFIPPANLEYLSASWDGGHKYAFIDNEGVQIYNLNQETKSILAPNRGEREYYHVEFSNDEKIVCLYKIRGNHYLEIYSSSLKLLNEQIRAQQVGWTEDNRLSYLNVNQDNQRYNFNIYSSKEEKYLSYFENYFGKSRYPLTFANSKTGPQTAFILRDNSGSKSSLILSLGNSQDDKLIKVAELLYLDREADDDQIVDPTIVWDKEEKNIYASVNNQIFKVELETGKAEELNLEFNGTVKAIGQDNNLLYIKRGNGQNDQIEKPKTVIVYNQERQEIVSQSSLAQTADFLNYSFWAEK